MIQGMLPSQGRALSAGGKCHQKGKVFLFLERELSVHVCPHMPTGRCHWHGLPAYACIDPIVQADCCHCQTHCSQICSKQHNQLHAVTEGGSGWISSPWPGLALCVSTEPGLGRLQYRPVWVAQRLMAALEAHAVQEDISFSFHWPQSKMDFGDSRSPGGMEDKSSVSGLLLWKFYIWPWQLSEMSSICLKVVSYLFLDKRSF